MKITLKKGQLKINKKVYFLKNLRNVSTIIFAGNCDLNHVLYLAHKICPGNSNVIADIDNEFNFLSNLMM